MRRLVVIGSGPAGVACARALAERGFRPLVVDAGRSLEPDRQAAVERARASAANGLDPAFVAGLESAFPVDVDRLPLKPVFGSLYAYAIDEPLLPLRAHGVAVVPSLALGGLSNVWGAAVLPYRDRDLDAWPKRARDLVPHYRSTFDFIPLAGEPDALGEQFPLHGDARPLTVTPQVAGVLQRVAAARGELARAGVVAGRSRLAVAAVESELAPACRYTGLCMYGCPHGSIWSAADTLRRLIAEGRVDYRRGLVAQRLVERAGAVVVHAARLGGGEEALTADRIFVACGAVESTRLVLASLEAHERRVRLLESSYFTLPLVSTRRTGPVGRGLAGNTLAQVFVELDPPSSDGRAVHVQIYGYNDLMLRALAGRARVRESLAERVLQPLLGRLLYAQGYLHSDDSPRMTVTLMREGRRNMLELAPGDGAAATAHVRAAVRRLTSLRPLTGLHPLRQMLQVWPQGKGFHVGGSLPMRDRPGELETDVLGRPSGLRRVHVVDASVFPSLPATTITLPVMANAQRIANAHDQD